MVQGTASSVGKSIIVTGLCRVFRQDGYRVAPFKSQNMALNSFITEDGGEMGRAQVAQAEAAGVKPDVRMNPILLKPTTDKKAQVIVNGKVLGNMSAMEYHEYKPRLAGMIRRVFCDLAAENDIIVIEGAGSPAEINLRDRDIVNMGMAEIAGAPVILVGDIDKGGVFAALAGTMLLLGEEEKRRVQGVIINKFRGDLEILKPGIAMLEDLIKVPVLGVIPYLQLGIDDEDSVTTRFGPGQGRKGTGEIEIAVVRLPHIANFTDFNPLERIPGVQLKYVDDRAIQKQGSGRPDLIILPGTKNTIEDLLYIRKSGMEAEILRMQAEGIPVFGICGGFQMLGTEIRDPDGVESSQPMVHGMGLLEVSTVLGREKKTVQVEATVTGNKGILEGTENQRVSGYEIHHGVSSRGAGCLPFAQIQRNAAGESSEADGAVNPAGDVTGTYIHGIFDNAAFTNGIINNLRKKKGLEPLNTVPLDYGGLKQAEYDKLARVIRENLDMEKIYQILNHRESGKDESNAVH
ncbi:MAG: cobyric acid synthase [Firmicutes bacterium]|nr:cobyric acid synthase [Bacillota bacterium]